MTSFQKALLYESFANRYYVQSAVPFVLLYFSNIVGDLGGDSGNSSMTNKATNIKKYWKNIRKYQQIVLKKNFYKNINNYLEEGSGNNSMTNTAAKY